MARRRFSPMHTFATMNPRGKLRSGRFGVRFLGENRQNPSIFSLEPGSKNCAFESAVRVDGTGCALQFRATCTVPMMSGKIPRPPKRCLIVHGYLAQKKQPPLWGHHRALGTYCRTPGRGGQFLMSGGGQFLMSEVTL